MLIDYYFILDTSYGNSFLLKSKLFLGNMVISKSCNVDEDMLTHSICIRTSAMLASCVVIYYAMALYKIVKFMYS